LEQWVFGTAEFAVGETVLVFLHRRPDGTLGTTGLGLGKYRVTGGTIALASRTLDGRVIGGDARETRSLKALRAAIRRHARRAAASVTAPDAVEQPAEAGDDALPHRTVSAFTYLGTARWNEPDSGQTVRYQVDQAGDAKLGPTASVNAIAAAMAAWSNVPTASLTLAVGGTAPARAMACDGLSLVVFNDPFGDVPDPSGCGGVLALGGYCATSAGRTTVGGVQFNRITEANITFNNGFAACSFWTQTNLAEVATHEIGHTLGIGHSSQAASESNPLLADATMYYRAHFDGRGAAVRADDVAALSSIYPGAAGPCAGAPAGSACPDDGNPCTSDVCDGAGACTHPNNTASCDDGNACTVADACSGGTCAGGRARVCSDGNPCTDDACAPASGCVYTPNTASCDDGNPCTTADACSGSTCAGKVTVACDDGNPCTDDACTQSGGCVHAPNTAPCDDGNPCTLDGCDPATGCRFVPQPDATPCSDGVFCNGLETCRAGACAAGRPPDCADAEACTADACDEARGRCVHDALGGCCTVDADCADADLCTVRERCEAGRCVADPLVCSDGGPCTRTTCDPVFGCRTDAQPDGAACDDGDACTTGEVCSAGTCGGGPGGQPIHATRFRLRAQPQGQQLVARAVLPAPLDFDPTASGVVLELVGPAGARLYGAELPGTAFTAGPAGRLFRFVARPGWQPPAGTNGLTRLEFQQRGQTLTVVARATVHDTAAILAADAVTWVIRSGAACLRTPRLTCAPASRSLISCR
jgi:hypothetical protein